MYAHQSVPDVLAALRSDHSGLTTADADQRLAEQGPNELPVAKRSKWRMLGRQFNSVLVYILLGAMALSVAAPLLEHGTAAPSDFLDAGVIFAILILNAALGFAQEFQAEEAIAALKKLSSHHARVRRSDGEVIVPARTLVTGDVVVLEAGDRVPADGRLLRASHLRIDESSLTGESVPAEKREVSLPKDTPVADQDNMVFSGTLVTQGEGVCVVTATALSTQIGQVATLVADTAIPQTPLQLRLQRLGSLLGMVTLVMCAVALTIGWWRGTPILEILLVAVSLAVSAVPEGLPAVVTACFAFGVRRMADAQALVRRLDALETLGSVTVICTDKTGTVTANRMTVAQHHTAANTTARELGKALASCNHAALPDIGDPTELALLVFANEHGVHGDPIDEEVVPFTSERKYMATLHGETVFYKGAPEVIFDLCQCEDPAADTFARQGLRVLAAAVERQGKPHYLGLVGMEDPPRAGVLEAVSEAQEAGIRTVLITGDNPRTGQAIAAQVGIMGDVLTGPELDVLDEAGLSEQLPHLGIYARVTPQHKLRILHALQAQGHVVAMSGDGVNDAPALRGAHVGIAMGARGTEVAREAAAIVLADDHFATIVTAIREGRRIHDNIRKFVLFLLRSNFDELLLVMAALAIELPLPLLPIHILWINLLTDGLPALALGTEPEEPGLMQRPPRPASQHLLSGEGFRLGLATALGFGTALALWVSLVSQGDDLNHARAVLLTFIIAMELGMAQSARSPLPFWRYGLLGNRWLLVAMATVAIAHIALLYTPLATAFQLAPLIPSDWALVLSLAFGVVVIFELFKPKRR